MREKKSYLFNDHINIIIKSNNFIVSFIQNEVYITHIWTNKKEKRQTVQ